MKCPNCWSDVSDAVATVRGGDEIILVQADCKKCGVVEPEGWEYEHFFPPEPEVRAYLH